MAPREKTKGEVSDLKAKLAAVIKTGTLPQPKSKDGKSGSSGKGQASSSAGKDTQTVRWAIEVNRAYTCFLSSG